MAGLVEHILRAADTKFRAHACRWVGLPEVTVPSAAVTDEDTARWSEERYARDLEQEPKTPIPEPEAVEGEVTIDFPNGETVKRYTPEQIDVIKYGRRLLALMGFGAMIAAGILGAGRAAADPATDSYVIVNAPIICALLDESPNVAGVENIGAALIQKGLNPQQAGEVLVRSVLGWCPSHQPELKAFINKWVPRKPVTAGVGGRMI